MTTKEFNKLIDNGEAQVLTLTKAQTLIGQKIIWTYFGYAANEQEVFESEISEIITEYERASRESAKGFASRAAEWESWMPAKRLQHTKERMVIMSNNKYTGIFCDTNDGYFDEPTFVCSDSDREVFFIVKRDEN